MLKFELLDAAHDRDGFDCGVEALNRYLKQVARQHVTRGIAKTYVLVEETSIPPKQIEGYFTISLCQVLGEEMPEPWRRKLPERVPAVKLGRQAGSKDRRGTGIGKSLLVEALFKVALIADIAGGIGLFVDAKDENAAASYARFGFVPLPGAPLTLFMPIDTIHSFSSTK